VPLQERAQNTSPRDPATVHVSLPQKRLPFQHTDRLSISPVNQSTQNSGEKWSDAEIKALVEFVLFHSSGYKWPTHKLDKFWNSAREFL